MSTKNLTETEVKISVKDRDASSVVRLLESHGLRVSVPRIFEANAVYDTVDQKIRGAEMLLRLRQVGDKNVITWKGPPVPGRYKSRPEIETRFDSFEALHQILLHLGYSVLFRYEKYRTEFSDAVGGGSVTFDETPIGNYLELEGEGPWIDEWAAKLGFKPEDYLLESYSRLYLDFCRETGVQPSHMTFASYTK
jgi:adenylate cyclase class 2